MTVLHTLAGGSVEEMVEDGVNHQTQSLEQQQAFGTATDLDALASSMQIQEELVRSFVIHTFHFWNSLTFSNETELHCSFLEQCGIVSGTFECGTGRGCCRNGDDDSRHDHR